MTVLSDEQFILFYKPPCGNWYVHSHKLYSSVRAGQAGARKFLTPGTMIAVLPLDTALLTACQHEVPETFQCKFCGCATSVDPSDQSPPLDYCDHEGDFA